MIKAVLLCSITVVSLAMLNACSLPHDYAMPQVKSVQELKYAKTFEEIKQINWPSDTWWTRYNDEQLNQLVSEAIEDSPTLKIAQARLKNAAGIAQQIGAIQKVNVGLEASASLGKVSYQYQSYMPPSGWNDYGSVNLNFSYEFDFWGKNKATLAAATSQFAAAEAEAAASRVTLSTSVVSAYAELARLYSNLKTVTAALKMRNKTVELLSKRYKAGLETQGAVKQASSSAASVEASLLAVQESIELQKNGISALLGKGPDRGKSITNPTVQLTGNFGLPKDAGIGLLGHRPDVVAARWQVEAAAENIGVAKAEFYPNVNISAFIGYQSFGLENLFNSGNDAGGIGPALYLPIFSGGRLEGQLTSAEAKYEEAVSGYNETLTRAFHDIANVITSTKALSAQVEKTREAVEAASSAYQIATNRYEGGLARYLDVLTAENALLVNQRALVNLESKAFSLDVALVRSLGGSYKNNQSQNDKDL